MKTLLAILLSFIMTEAPVLAIHGGYSLGAAGSVTGTYAGIMVPTQDTVVATGSNASDFGANALGIFTLSVPATGVGTGTIYLYSGGTELTGPIQCLPDPRNTNGIVGVIAATGSTAVVDNFFGFGFQFTDVTATASGGLTVSTLQSTFSDSPTGTDLTGTANVTVTTSTTGTNGNQTLTPTDQVTFEVFGFQQSTATQ